MSKTTPRDSRRARSQRRRTDGWTITPRTIGIMVSILALIAGLVKPVEVGMQLSNSIDKLATSVGQLQSVMKEQGDDITLLKSKTAGFEALKDARDKQIQALESRLSALELRVIR